MSLGVGILGVSAIFLSIGPITAKQALFAAFGLPIGLGMLSFGLRSLWLTRSRIAHPRKVHVTGNHYRADHDGEFGTVRIDRPAGFGELQYAYTVSLDGKEVGSLRFGDYIELLVGAGEHTVSARVSRSDRPEDLPSNDVTVVVEAGSGCALRVVPAAGPPALRKRGFWLALEPVA